MREEVWKEYCSSCKKKHMVTLQPCPECSGRGGWIPMPKSEAVRNECKFLGYQCDGCEAYRGHLS